MRSRTPMIRSRGANGSGLVTQVVWRIASSERPSTRPMARMISVVSSNPLVVMKPTLTPLRVISAFVATVLPCLKSEVWPRSSFLSMPTVFAASVSASITPREKSSGVVVAFAVQTLPASLMTTMSVNVPPVSTPTMYSSRAAIDCLSRKTLQAEIWDGWVVVKAVAVTTPEELPATRRLHFWLV